MKDVGHVTARVLRGSAWNIGGQLVTVGAAFLATPIVIRQLGTDAYGVLSLVNLLVGYMAFADLGMGEASTRFAAASHEKDEGAEASVIWTSLAITVVPTTLGALALMLGADCLVRDVFLLPQHIAPASASALRIAALGLAARGLAGVLNTPQLVRLRLDLCTIINAGGAALQILLVPAVLALGGGLPGAVWVISGMACAIALAHAAAALRLLPQLARPRFQRGLLGPLSRYGAALALTSLTGVALAHGEKLMLTRFGSVRALAHYTVATTLAGFLGMVPIAIGQAIAPAFARLAALTDRQPLERLYCRVLQANLLAVVPAAVVLCVSAHLFLTLWAGPEFGRNSTVPLYILVVGLVVNVITFVPYKLFVASGRAAFNTRYHAIELIPYLCAAGVLTHWLGAAGGAAAWSGRLVVALFVFLRAARRLEGMKPSILPMKRREYLASLLVLLVPVVGAALGGVTSVYLIGIALLAVAGYALLVWRLVLTDDERGMVARLLTVRRLAPGSA